MSKVKGKRLKVAHTIMEMEAELLGTTVDKIDLEAIIESPTRYFYDIVLHKEDGTEKFKNRHSLKTDVARKMNGTVK